jgi:hypothetical protein
VNEWKCLSKKCVCQQAEQDDFSDPDECLSSLTEASDRNNTLSFHLPLMRLELISSKQCVLGLGMLGSR